MALTIDNLQIQIETKAQNATDGIDALTTSLTNLKSSIGDTSGLVNTLTKLSTAMRGLSTAKSLANGLTELNKVTSVLNTDRLTEFSQQMAGVADALSQLSVLEKSNLGSIINPLKKIPDITKELKPEVIDEFGAAIKRLVEILAPLASQMETVSRGFSMLPNRMKSTIKASQQVANSNARMYKSYNSLGTQLARTMAKFWTLYYSMQRLVNIFADAFNTSNEYIESLNLFRVSMGETGDAAMVFAEKVSALMGIDIAEWITNQGSFMRMSTGFGIATDKAEVMSKNLTQLAYDMSSFFNVDVQTAMDKLQSGMSGQIKGLKEWGYNLSVASLQETALSLGIEQSVRTMTEAQKAQLRYITLIQRSNGVMGDMAKTINTPANAMRILAAQLTRLERAFGNIVSVLVTKYIPYVMAFVELMEEGAKALADMWGFEIPDLPENNLEMGAAVIEGVGDEADETANKLAEMKRQIMGFDELNILKSDDDKSSELPSYDLGIDLPDYDFLNGLSSKYREEIDKIKVEIKEFGEVLKTLEPIAIALAALFAFEWISGALAKFKQLKAITLLLNLMSGAAQNAQLVFEGTGSILQGLGGGFTYVGKTFSNFMKNLSPLTKFVVGVVALGAELLVVKDAVHDFTEGTSTCGEMLLKIIPISAAVGTAMYAMLGPWGLVAAAVAGVAGAVWGFIDAQNDAIEELMNTSITETFYDGVGTDIGEIATAFDNWTLAIKNSKTEIITMGTEVGTAKDNVQKVTDSITNLATQVTLGFKTIEETVPKIKEQFQTLYDDTYNILSKEAELIYYALAGSTGKSLEAMGFNIEQYGKYVGETVFGATEELKALHAEAEELIDAMNRDTAEFEEMGGMTALLDISAEIAKLSGVEVDPLGDFVASLNNISWNSLEDATSAFDTIATSAQEAKDAINTSFDEEVAAIEHLKSLTNDPAAIKAFDQMIEGFTRVKESELASIDEATQKVLDAFQADLVWSLEDQVNAAVEGWNRLNWWQREIVYHGDAYGYVKDQLETFVDGDFKTLMENMVSEFGADADWASEAMQKILDDAFVKLLGGNTEMGDLKVSIVDALPEHLKQSGQDAVAGLTEGLETTDDIINAAKDLAEKGILNPFNGRMRIHSPSKEMEDSGLYSVQGLANGVSNNAYLVINSFDAMFVAIEERFLKFATNCKTAMTELTTSLSGKYTTDSSLTANVNTSAIGSKTAIATDSNLINGIASAVYNAVMSANEDTSSSGGESKIVVAIDGDKVGETSVKYINGKFVQTGVSPICY